MLSLNTTFDELKLSGIRRFAAMAKETPGCISLTLGEPDADTSDEVKAEVPADLAAGFTHYPPNNGYDFVRNALSEHMASFGKHYAPQEIILTCGATEALFVALTSVLNPGDEVIVPTPAFTLYESLQSIAQLLSSWTRVMRRFRSPTKCWNPQLRSIRRPSS